MKKTLLSVLGLLTSLMAFSQATDLFFSEYVEGSSNNKYLEIFNGTGATVNLSDYQVLLFSNGNADESSPSQTLDFGDIQLSNNDVYIIANSSADIYNSADVTSSVTWYNGDDAIALKKKSTGNYVDIIGCIGERVNWSDGNHSTTNKTLVRKASVSGGVTSNPASGFPTLVTEWSVFAQDNVDNLGTHTFSTVAGSLKLTSPNGGENYDAGDIVKLMWNSTDVANVYFEVYNDDMEWSSITGNIASVDGANEYDFTIPANAFTWDSYKLRVVDADNASTLDESDAAFSIDGHDKQLLWEDFNGSQFNVSAQFSVSGDDKVWTANDGFARMNGYDNSNQETQEDWLITNAIDLNTTHSELLDFSTSLQYPADDSDLKVYYSTDYVPANDPNSYVWTELSVSFATGASYTHSGYIDISAINGDVYFGFKYTSTATAAEWWQIKDINISGVNNDQSGPTNIEASEKTAIKVGPNPFTYELTIECEKDINRVLLFNTTGQLVKSCVDFNGKLETAELPSGMYILQIEFSDTSTSTHKVVKK